MRSFVYLAKRFLQETPLGTNKLSSKDRFLAYSACVASFMVLVTLVSSVTNGSTNDSSLSYERASLSLLKAASGYEASQLIVTSNNQAKNYSFVEYVTKESKEVKDVARNFGVSPDTIRWANNLTGGTIKAGAKLQIPPVTGLEYKVKKGDTVSTIAAYFNAEQNEIIAFNAIKMRIVEQDQIIFIPGGEKPILPSWKNDPSGYSTVVIARNSTPAYGENAYPWGNCTWYVFNRRMQMSRPIANGLGNARSWPYTAKSRGYLVNHIPELGAVMAESRTNHVAIVEQINPDGSILISEMNFNWRLGIKSFRNIPGSSVSNHYFIH